MLASTRTFQEVPESEYHRAVKALLKTPVNTRLTGSVFLTTASGYVAKSGGTGPAFTTVGVKLADNQALSRGFVSAAMRHDHSLLSANTNQDTDQALQFSTESTFFQNWATAERAADGTLLSVTFATPHRFCMVPGNQCEAYVAFTRNTKPARHHSRLRYQVFKVHVGEFAKFVAFNTSEKGPMQPENIPQQGNVKTLAA